MEAVNLLWIVFWTFKGAGLTDWVQPFGQLPVKSGLKPRANWLTRENSPDTVLNYCSQAVLNRTACFGDNETLQGLAFLVVYPFKMRYNCYAFAAGVCHFVANNWEEEELAERLLANTTIFTLQEETRVWYVSMIAVGNAYPNATSVRSGWMYMHGKPMLDLKGSGLREWQGKTRNKRTFGRVCGFWNKTYHPLLGNIPMFPRWVTLSGFPKQKCDSWLRHGTAIWGGWEMPL